MKKTLFFLIALMFSLPFMSLAQNKHAVSQQHQKLTKHKSQIHSVVQKNQTVEFTISSTKSFYVGGNIHILHIGDKQFRLSKQTKGKVNTITFLIPEGDFNNLVEGNNIYMTYGQLFNSPPNEEEAKKLSATCPNTFWTLGKFTKSLLKK